MISAALACGRSRAHDDDQDQEREPAEAKVEKFVEELFLGEIVYPQDQGEFQFTTGYLKANKGNDFLFGAKGEDDFEIPLLFEYGLTGYVQLVAEVLIGFKRTGRADREEVGKVESTVYLDFLNDPRSGRARGYGMALGLDREKKDDAAGIGQWARLGTWRGR